MSTNKNIITNGQPDVKPEALPVKFECIPDLLKKFDAWVLWRYKLINGKWNKVPYQPSGKPADCSDPATWSSFDDVRQAYESGKYDGVDFALHEDAGVIGIDEDDAITTKGQFTETASKIKERFDGTYIEVSPSQTGLHVFALGSVPGDRNRNGKHEVYTTVRFITVTGHSINSKKEITHQQDAINWYYWTFIEPPRASTLPPPSNNGGMSPPMSDDEVIRRASNAKNSNKFLSLWSGNPGNYSSDSEADSALAMLIGYWSQDIDQVERIMRQSGLQRDKWNRREHGAGYLHRTIERALESMTTFYQPPKDYQQTELGNAERLRDRFGDRIRWCELWKRWLVFNGQHWMQDTRKQVQRWFLDDIVPELICKAGLLPTGDIRKKATTFAATAQRRSHVEAVTELMKTREGIAVDPKDFDDPVKTEFLLCCKNGLLELDTMKFRQHQATDMITRSANVVYDPKATCPRWIQFIDEITDNNKEMAAYLQRIAGYCLTGTMPSEFFVLVGVGSNGKTVLTATLLDMLGDYSRQIQAETYMIQQRDSAGASEDIASIKGSRLLCAVEGSPGQKLATGLIKQLSSGGDRITARHLYSAPFEFQNTAKLLLCTNHAPVVRETSLGIWRRIRLIQFNVTFEPSRQDTRLIYKLKKEKSGILNWSIAGLKQWLESGLQDPTSVIEATREYQDSSDVVGRWISENCFVSDVKTITPASDLYKNYREWCEENGHKPMSAASFAKALIEKGYKRRKGRANKYEWLKLAIGEETIY